MAYTGVSIVDYLKSVGQASDYATRQKLAQQYGITNYTGTAEQNTQLLNTLKSGGSPTATASSGGNVYAQIEELQKQVGTVQTQLQSKQAQMEALKKYGLERTGDLTQDAQGNWVPRKDERADALKEAEEYYGYQIPTDRAGAYYPIQLQELEDEVGKAKQRLTEDYNQYLSDIQTGKLRVGTDHQKQVERALEEKTQQLQQQEFNVKQNMENLNRQWMGRGGLFSGARLQAGQQYMTQEEMAKERYTTGWEFGQQQQRTGYERTMEDYGTQAQRAGIAHQRGTEDIAQRRLKDVRSLQETYQAAIGRRMGSTLESKYY